VSFVGCSVISSCLKARVPGAGVGVEHSTITVPWWNADYLLVCVLCVSRRVEFPHSKPAADRMTVMN
jgi:hypothetical protein